jgi:hypothetical protein
MKNLQKILSSIFISALMFSSAAPVFAEDAVEDAFCDNANITAAEDWWRIKAHTSLSQTFLPKKTKLNKIMLALAGGAAVPGTVKMDLYQIGGGLVTSKTEAVTAELVSWVEFDFPTVTVDTTKQYKITVTTTSDTAYWVISLTQCYDGGNAIVDTTNYASHDFGFVTYGYDPATPTPSPTPTTKPATPTPTATTTPSPTVTPTEMLDEDEEVSITPTEMVKEESDQSGFFILAAIVWVLFIGGVVIYIIMRERKKFEQQLKIAVPASSVEEKPKTETANESSKEDVKVDSEDKEE